MSPLPYQTVKINNALPSSPSEHPDLVLQRVLLALERLLVDHLDGVHRAGLLAALGQADLRERAPGKKEKRTLILITGKPRAAAN